MAILKSLILVYIGFALILFIFQRYFYYHPSQIESYDVETLSTLGVEVVSDKGMEWIYWPAAQKTNKTLVYFHGNAGMAFNRLSKASVWRDSNFNVILAEYPGYGTNGGKSSEQSFYNVGRVVIDKMLSDFPNTELYIYGESVGSGTATQMATEYDEKVLIIESGFSSLVDVVFSKMPFFPASLLVRDKYDNLSKINNIGSRLIWLHGAQDKIVPMRFGQALFDAYKGEKDFRIFDNAGHNDIYEMTDMNAVIRDLNL